ncbi:MAG: SCP2 sterol-binding domain-containing protein [Burkholderiales bacterium]|nr:SCP2 sterol-binding domain-containing protein [Burkholderiales bacterium]
MLPPFFPAALNHLLAQEAWARAKLVPHAGKCACIDVSLLQIKLVVGSDGLLLAATPEQVPSVTIRINLADLPLILQNRERAFSSAKVEGDAEFASVIAHLAQNLRWEAEYDLQKIFGEIAARRMVEGGKQAAQLAEQSRQKLNENLAEYFLEENPMLVRPQAVEAFGNEVAKLRDDVERLEKRLQKLGQKLP